MAERCLNCSAVLAGTYCNQCGQKAIEPGIRFKDVVGDFLSYSFSIEGPVGQTIKLLILKPGELFRSYIDGKRRSYYRPIQFFIISCFLYFAFGELIGYDSLKGEFSQTRPDNLKEVMSRVEESTRFMVKNMNNLVFLIVFFLAAFIKLFNWKKGRYAEFLAVSFYIVGAYVLFGITDQIAFLFDTKLGAGRILFYLLYTTYAYASFMGKFSFASLFKGITVAVLSFMGYFVVAFGLGWILTM